MSQVSSPSRQRRRTRMTALSVLAVTAVGAAATGPAQARPIGPCDGPCPIVTIARPTFAYSTPYLDARTKHPVRPATYVAICEAQGGPGPNGNRRWTRMREGTWVNNDDISRRTGRVGCTTPAPPSDALPGARTLRYQYQPQQTSYWCSAGAARIALSVRGRIVAQAELARRMKLNSEVGLPSINNLRDALNDYTGSQSYDVKDLDNDTELHQQLRADVLENISRGYAVVVNVDRIGGRRVKGHYATIVGYRANGASYLFADPASSREGVRWRNAEDVVRDIKLDRYVA
jgi:hypothetical protein